MDSSMIQGGGNIVLDWLYAFVFSGIPKVLMSLLSLSVTVPSTIYTILSYTVTFTFNFTSIFILVVFITATTYILIRYRFLTKYSRLPFIQRRPGPPIDLQPTEDGTDLETDDASYPNEFLSAFLSSIKVFGYLEGPVFNELARSLQTKTLLPEEVLFDYNDIPTSFYIVVDGCMQVFIGQKSELEEQKDVLLNEVKAGGTVTSLFSILSLLGKDHSSSQQPPTPPESLEKLVSKEEEEVMFPNLSEDAPHKSVSHNSDLNLSPMSQQSSPAFRMGGESGAPLHLNLVARAKTKTTLAVIPAEVFKKLNRKFPVETAHIVQVILARFQRVTFLTLHRYLGLTSELTEIERKVNESAGEGLPSDFYTYKRGQRLPRRSRTSSPVLKEELKHINTSITSLDDNLTQDDIKPAEASEQIDSYDSDEEELTLKEIVFRCISSQIGLVEEHELAQEDMHRNIPPRAPTSRLSSPHYSSRMSAAANSETFMDDSFDTMSTSSVTSAVSVTSSILSNVTSENQISIERYEKGAYLVHAGQYNPGIYFLIDGLLEVSVPDNQRNHSSQLRSLDNCPNKKLFTIQPGGMSGYLASVTGHPSFVNVRAEFDCTVGFLSKASLDRIIEKYPSVLFMLARRLTCHLSPLM
jgi:lysophospholipid hydrolase